jgi:hypothetical protein
MTLKPGKTAENHAPTHSKTMGVSVAKLADNTNMSNHNKNADLIRSSRESDIDPSFGRVVTYIHDKKNHTAKPIYYDPESEGIKA